MNFQVETFDATKDALEAHSLGPVQAVQRDFPALVMMARLMLLGVVAAVVLGGVWLALRKKK